jgi:hypothetical protein
MIAHMTVSHDAHMTVSHDMSHDIPHDHCSKYSVSYNSILWLYLGRFPYLEVYPQPIQQQYIPEM